MLPGVGVPLGKRAKSPSAAKIPPKTRDDAKLSAVALGIGRLLREPATQVIGSPMIAICAETPWMGAFPVLSVADCGGWRVGDRGGSLPNRLSRGPSPVAVRTSATSLPRRGVIPSGTRSANASWADRGTAGCRGGRGRTGHVGHRARGSCQEGRGRDPPAKADARSASFDACGNTDAASLFH